MSWGNAYGTRAWGGGAPYTVSTATPISLDANSLHAVDHVVGALVKLNVPANTLHVVDHVVGALVKINVPATTLHVVDHIVSGVLGIVVEASTLHVVAHPVTATAPISATANTLHVVDHIVGAKPPISASANTLHVVVHPVQASAPIGLAANSLHAQVHIVPIGIGPGAATLHISQHIVPVTTVASLPSKPIVVLLNHVTPVYNPTVTTTVGGAPLVNAALLDRGNYAEPIVPLTGASVVFELAYLGGDAISTRAVTIDDIATANVSYQAVAEDITESGKYLGRFRVTYPNTAEQNFPGDRYIEFLVS